MTDFLYDPDTGMETSMADYHIGSHEERKDQEDTTDGLTQAAKSLQKSIEANKE